MSATEWSQNSYLELSGVLVIVVIVSWGSHLEFTDEIVSFISSSSDDDGEFDFVIKPNLFCHAVMLNFYFIYQFALNDHLRSFIYILSAVNSEGSGFFGPNRLHCLSIDKCPLKRCCFCWCL